MPAGSSSASGYPAGSVPAGGEKLAGSTEPAGSIPAASTSVSADSIPVYAEATTLPLVPSDVCKDRLSSGIFTSSSYDDDFSATLTNLAPIVAVNPIPTKRVNTVHPQSQIIGTKWILKNKMDARGIVVRNKARLVAHGHRQEEGIDYDEVFTPVARIEAIRLFLAFAS
nr:retrovirus-related Pol polyprotein from transposon TNT 1-94 [Tanacetum cinerariifolium]